MSYGRSLDRSGILSSVLLDIPHIEEWNEGDEGIYKAADVNGNVYLVEPKKAPYVIELSNGLKMTVMRRKPAELKYTYEQALKESRSSVASTRRESANGFQDRF